MLLDGGDVKLVELLHEALEPLLGELDGLAAFAQVADQRRNHLRKPRLLPGALLRDNAPQEIVERAQRFTRRDAVLAVLFAEQRQIIGPRRLDEASNGRRNIAAGQAVAKETAHAAAIGLGLLRRRGRADVGHHRSGRLPTFGVDESRDPLIGFVERRQIDFEARRHIVDHVGGERFQRRAIIGIVGRADRRGRQQIERVTSRIARVLEKRRIEQRALEDRHLQARDERTKLVGDRRVARRVFEQQRDDVERRALGRMLDRGAQHFSDIGHEVLRQCRAGLSAQRSFGFAQDCGRQVHSLQRRQHGNRRCRSAEREHRIEIGKFVVVARAMTAIAIARRCGRLSERAKRGHDRRRRKRRPIAGGRRRGAGASDHPGLGEKVLERWEKVGIVGGAQCTARAQRRIDFRQHLVRRQEPVQRHVDLVDARRDVGKDALHQRPPDPRLRVNRPGRDADRIEHVGRRERIVDFADVTLRHQRSEALIERGDVLTSVLVQVRHRVHERFLLRLIEVGEHLDVARADLRIGTPSLAPLARHAALVELVDRPREMLEPLAAARLEALDLRFGNLGIPFEQVGRHLERRARHVDQTRPVLGEALAQQRARFRGPDARRSSRRVSERRPGQRRILGRLRHVRAHSSWCAGRATSAARMAASPIARSRPLMQSEHIRSKRIVRALERVLDAVGGATSVLALPLSVLLFLQWPLREWLGFLFPIHGH